MKIPPKIHLILLFINLVYAVNYILIKEVVPVKMGPFALMFFRALAAFLVFTIIHHLFYRERIERADFPKIMLCALFGVGLNGMLFLKGISLTQPINASLIMILVPILVMIIAYFLLKESLYWQKILGGIIGLIGAYILITKLQMIEFGGKTIRGDLFILMNATSLAVYLILARQFLKKYHPLTMARYLFTFGLLFITPFCIPELRKVSVAVLTMSDYFIIAFILIFPTCINYYLYNLALKKVSATVASSYIFLQPLFTTIIALSLNKDELDIYKIIGGCFIFIGVSMVNFWQPKGS